MSNPSSLANATPSVGESPNAVAGRATDAAGSFEHLIATSSREEKRRALYLLARDLLGPRAERELGIVDPDGFLYACIMPPGRREALLLLEDPERARRLNEPAQDTIPLRDVLQQLAATK